MDERRKCWDGKTRRVISLVSALPEDYVGPEEAAALRREANEELLQLVRGNRDLFEAAVLTVPMNNIEEAYDAHRATKHFKAYIAATADCLSEKELIPLAGDTLASKGSLH